MAKELAVSTLYDSIGVGYSGLRLPDKRISKVITDALANAASVVNVGAGTGSYEPLDKNVVAVEPSLTMIRQRSPAAAPAIQANAMALPFPDESFDAGLAILTIHHWPQPDVGLREMARVARDRVVLLTWDPVSPGFWLTEYFPGIMDIDRSIFPTLDELERCLGRVTVRSVPIPADCTDGFLGAYWRRPASYLEASVRSAISTFPKLGDLTAGLQRLRQDIATGQWHRRWGHLLEATELDLGYRLVISDPGRRQASGTGSCPVRRTARIANHDVLTRLQTLGTAYDDRVASL